MTTRNSQYIVTLCHTRMYKTWHILSCVQLALAKVFLFIIRHSENSRSTLHWIGSMQER